MQIQVPGLASGLDSTTLIAQLMQAESQPRTRLADQQAQMQARQQALKDVETRLRNLQDATADLRLSTLFANAQTVDTSDASLLTATRTSGAGPGVYDVAVSQVATAEQRTYAYTASTADTTIEINGHSTTIAANATLDDAVAAINNDAEAQAFATNVAGNLVLSSKHTGATGPGGGAALQVTSTQLSEIGSKLGKDASFTIDGTAFTSATNVVENAIPGLTLTIKGTSPGVNVVVGEPGPDRDAIKAKLKAFVDQYNSTIDFIQGKLSEETVPDPRTPEDILDGKADSRTAAQKAQGVLHGDTMLSQTLTQLRQTISAAVPGLTGSVQSLYDIGISTGAASGTAQFSADSVAGKLQFDPDKLDAALDADPDAVRKVIGSGTGITGFAQIFSAVLDPVANANGTLDGRISSSATQVSDLGRQMADWDVRLKLKQQQYEQMFTNLEVAMSKSQSQQQWLTGQLAALG